MKIITDNDVLKTFIPNYFTECVGEATFFEKLYPWLLSSEEWFINEILGDFVDEIVERGDRLYQIVASGVAAHALYHAVPSLDLVLTPNGFGVINTTNVAPASKERVDRLRSSLLKLRDNQISLILYSLLRNEDWRASAQGQKFASSIFMHPNDVTSGCSYDEFLNFRSSSLLIESALAVKAISPELMAALRSVRYLSASVTQDVLINQLKTLVHSIKSGSHSVSNSLADVVQFIRSNPEEFPEWATSATAELYAPAVFENKKDSTGYWF